MVKYLTSANKIEKVLDENYFFILLESKVIFKNHNERISLNLNQISNIRLVKNRDFTLNILVLVFAGLLYLIVLYSLNINNIFQYLIVGLIPIFVIVVATYIENYSYKLLINKNDYSYNEILVSKKSLNFANLFISKFPLFSISKNKLKQEFEYQNLKTHRF